MTPPSSNSSKWRFVSSRRDPFTENGIPWRDPPHPRYIHDFMRVVSSRFTPVQEQFLANGRLCSSFPFGALAGMGYYESWMIHYFQAFCTSQMVQDFFHQESLRMFEPYISGQILTSAEVTPNDILGRVCKKERISLGGIKGPGHLVTTQW